MVTPLAKTSLRELLRQPILLDANILMVGITERRSNPDYAFERMERLYINPLFESFADIYIHAEVYNELDDEARFLVDRYKGKNVSVVDEGGLYGADPKYTVIFNHIAEHELVRYVRGESKNRGEVYSLAYAAYHNMNFFCSRDAMVDNVARELIDLQNVDIITFDVVLLVAYIYYARKNDNSYGKGLKSVYKKYCADVIKRHGLPATLGGYVQSSIEYL